MKAVTGFLDLIDKLLLAIGALAVVLVMGIGVAEILGRGIFNAPIRGQIDVIESMMPLVALLALGYNLRDGSHICMSLLIDRLPDRLRFTIEAAGLTWALSLGPSWPLGPPNSERARYGSPTVRPTCVCPLGR